MTKQATPTPEISLDTSGIGTYGGTVIATGTDREQLLSAETRHAVVKAAAARGLSRPGVNNVDVYPVDSNGVCDEDVLLGKRPAVGFRAEYSVAGGM